MAETVTCNGCGREAEMEYEPEPSAERDIPVLPTGWEAEDDDEHYCPDCVVRNLRNRLKERELRLEEAAKISHEMLRDERDLFKAMAERLEGEHGLFVETTNKTIATMKQEIARLTEMRRVGHGRLEALVRRAYVERIGQHWLEEAESFLGLSKTQEGRRSLRTEVECDRCEKLARAKELEESAKAVTRSVQAENERLLERVERFFRGK